MLIEEKGPQLSDDNDELMLDRIAKTMSNAETLICNYCNNATATTIGRSKGRMRVKCRTCTKTGYATQNTSVLDEAARQGRRVLWSPSSSKKQQAKGQSAAQRDPQDFFQPVGKPLKSRDVQGKSAATPGTSYCAQISAGKVGTNEKKNLNLQKNEEIARKKQKKS